jgi:hypothetical protein
MSYRTQILNMSMAVMLLSICISCKRAGRPARVMLPDTITYSAGVLGEKMLVPTVADNFPFYTSDTTVTINGVQRSLLAIAVPDQQSYEPLAGFLWAELQRDHKTGVLVNFCGDSKNSIQKRQDITMQNFKGEDLPASVVFVWDSSSAFRANYFIQQLSQMSEIKIGRETTVSDDFLQLKPTINN